MTSTSTIVLITGANTGLGYAVSQPLLEDTNRTYVVLLGSRSLERGKEAAKALAAEIKGGQEILPVQIDIDDEESIDALQQRIQSDFGRIDVLVNNAGEPEEDYDYSWHSLLPLETEAKVNFETRRTL